MHTVRLSSLKALRLGTGRIVEEYWPWVAAGLAFNALLADPSFSTPPPIWQVTGVCVALVAIFGAGWLRFRLEWVGSVPVRRLRTSFAWKLLLWYHSLAQAGGLTILLCFILAESVAARPDVARSMWLAWVSSVTFTVAACLRIGDLDARLFRHWPGDAD